MTDPIREAAEEALRFLTPATCGGYHGYRKVWDRLRAALDTDLTALERRAEQAERQVQELQLLDREDAGWKARAEQAEMLLSLETQAHREWCERALKAEAALEKVTRLHLVDHRESVPFEQRSTQDHWNVSVELNYQDDGRTLKVFMRDAPMTSTADLDRADHDGRTQPRSVGLTYEGERVCVVHGGAEMEHTCAGGPGEPLGYCSSAPDTEGCRFDG